MSIKVTKNKDYSNGKELSQRAFNLTIGGFLMYGFIINFIMTMFFSEQIMKIPLIPFIIGYLVVGFIGILMMKSDSPIQSFIGYNLLVLPIGCAIAMCVPGQSLNSIFIALVVTGVVTIAMMIAGTIKPDFFLGLGKVLIFALAICIVVEIALVIFGVHFAIWDWIISLVFCGFIACDWARANNVPYKTLNYAIDMAGELYLDIINLFLNILSIVSGDSAD